MKPWLVLAIVLCLAAGLPAAALVPRPDAAQDPRTIEPATARVQRVDADPAAVGSSAQTARQFLAEVGGSWEITVDPRTGRAVMVQGSGIPLNPGPGGSTITVDALEPLARSFLSRRGALALPDRGELELDRRLSSIRGGGRLASLYFRWRVDGVPVEGASVFVRLNSGNVVQFGAPFVGSIGTATDPAVGADKALSALLDYTGDGELYALQGEPELLLQPEDGNDGGLGYRLVWRILYEVPGKIESWEGRVDASTGTVVGFRDLNRYGRIVGGVYPRTVFDQNEVTVPFPLTNAVADGMTLLSDTAGAFPFSGGSAVSQLLGPVFSSNCSGCSGQPRAEFTTGTGRLDFGVGGVDQIANGASTPADRNTIFHLNQVRRIAKKWLPGQAWLDMSMNAFVNINDTCNASYNPGSNAVNFFRSGGGCNNSGEIADVIYHEWGHGVDLNTRAGDGATGEGTADVVSMHVTHSPIMGPGFGTNGAPVRNLDPNGPRGLLTTTNIALRCPIIGSLGPLGFEVHCEGEIYGQAAWELAQALVARYGHHTGWRASERLFFESLPDAQSYLASGTMSIYDAMMMADDDDGNLANGTPHASEIFDAFDRHGIAGTLRPASAACTRPTQPVLSVTPQCDRFELSWDAVPGVDHYEILRGELREDQALFPLATVPAGETTYTDTEVSPALDYWYVVMAVDASGCESTIENLIPARLTAQPVLSVTSATIDDLPRGNRSGFADPGEEVDLVLALTNFGDAAASGLGATISTTTPGVTLLDAQSGWAQLDPGATAQNLDVLRFQTDDAVLACGATIDFQLLPAEPTGCAGETSYFTVELGDSGVCDPTPACFVEPTFDGLDGAIAGPSCGEIDLVWQPATSNCTNATLSYNIYRSTDPAFVPGPANRIATGLSGTNFQDALLQPGLAYHYLVRAFDTRSGEDGNVTKFAVTAPTTPDIRAPLFDGLASASTGSDCGEIALSWNAASESCNAPVLYQIYRSTDPGFVPGPASLVASTTSTTYTDAALPPAASHTYVVRARDNAGNEDPNTIRFSVAAAATDRILHRSDFESGTDGWTVVTPNDASTGNWEWGDPLATDEQPGDCAEGFSCWITGLLATLSGGGNNDVDDGTTTLRSRSYDLVGAVDPAVRYQRWFTNDLGSNPGEDPLIVEISSNNGFTWSALEEVNGTPAAWIESEVAIPGTVPLSSSMRFRFTASDLGAGGSLVEAGVDDFTLIDRDQGCNGCPTPVQAVGTVLARRSGDDVLLDWTADPTPGTRFVIYALSGPTFGDTVRLGTVDGRLFVHEDAAALPDSLSYRVTAVDACGNESGL